MKIALLYTAVSGAPTTADFAARFVSTYHEHSPGAEHDTIVGCNNGALPFETELLFAGLPNCTFFPRSNDGWDIGLFVDAARGPAANYDMLLCLGESVYFHRPGWLRRIVDEWERYGPGFYGFFSSHVIRAHLQTTAFAVSPEWLRRWPFKVTSRQDRYDFEHGPRSLWRMMSANGKPTMLVTWDGCWKPGEWRFPRDILWRGSQTNCLLWCNHSEMWTNIQPRVKAFWQRAIDQPFK